MTDCERTALYLDGELPLDEEATAQAHLASCAACQAELADWVGMETALSRSRSARPEAAALAEGSQDQIAAARQTPAYRRPAGARPGMAARQSRAPSRARWVAGAMAVAAIVVVVLFALRRSPPQALVLADTRTVEARLTAPAFDHHRPYRVGRDASARELVPIEALAELEHSGDRAGLAAAHVVGGDMARATAVLEAMPPSPSRDSDLAAVALAADPARALRLADAALAAAPDLAAAHWNRALALRALDLPLAAAAEFDAVAARGEPGWADEARARAAALRAAMHTRRPDFDRYLDTAAAMVARRTGPIEGELVARHPGLARRTLLDALATAASPDEARALAPLAHELDRLAGSDRASRMVADAAARDFSVRQRFRADCGALAAGKLDAAHRGALLDALDAAGEAVADMRVDALLAAPASGPNVARLGRAIASLGNRGADDPWLAAQLARRDGRARLAAGDLFGAEQALRAAAPACRDPASRLICGYIDAALGELYERMRRLEEAELRFSAARAAFAVEGDVELDDHTLQNLVNLERLRDRDGVAEAYLEEIRLREPDRCQLARFVGESRAAIALAAGNVAAARARLPELRSDCPLSSLLLIDAIDIARVGTAADRDRAVAWSAAARAAGGEPGVVADIGEGRLRLDDDPVGGAARIRTGLAALGSLGAAPGTAGELRAWGTAALIGDAGRRGDWAGALALFAEELGREAPSGCLAAASLDNERSTAVVRGRDGMLRGSYQRDRKLDTVAADTIIPPALASALAGCEAVAVIARPPLHGRSELLPSALPWSFLGAGEPAIQHASPGRRVIVSDARPPASLGLPALAPIAPGPGDDAVLIAGAAATPSRVQAELGRAGYVEIDAHGIVDARDAAFLALSPDADGRFALTAAEVGALHLAGAPTVVLGACRSAKQARYAAFRWSLPDAFLTAGARAVVASATAIPDDQGAALFAELRARIARGEPVARAVADLRVDRLARGQSWAAGLIVFE